MTKTERQRLIYKCVQEQKTVSMELLVDMFGVTNETIRKDLIQMDAEGFIVRTFGGAMLREWLERPMQQRERENDAEKKAIALEAVKLLREKDFITMDSGTTVMRLVNYLPIDLSLTVLTNIWEVAERLRDHQNIMVLLTGGQLLRGSMTMGGYVAEGTVRSFKANKAFLSCEGLDPHYGTMDSSEEAARIKQAMMEVADEVYVLADHTKFKVITHVRCCPLNKITALITDEGTEPSVIKQYEDAGVKVIVGRK